MKCRKETRRGKAVQATIPGDGSEWNHDNARLNRRYHKVCKAESLCLWITIDCQKHVGTDPLMAKEAALLATGAPAVPRSLCSLEKGKLSFTLWFSGLKPKFYWRLHQITTCD